MGYWSSFSDYQPGRFSVMFSFIFRFKSILVLLLIPLTGIVIVLGSTLRRIEMNTERISHVRLTGVKELICNNNKYSKIIIFCNKKINTGFSGQMYCLQEDLAVRWAERIQWSLMATGMAGYISTVFNAVSGVGQSVAVSAGNDARKDVEDDFQYGFLHYWHADKMIVPGIVLGVLIVVGGILFLRYGRRYENDLRFRQLLNSMDEGVCELDLNGLCIFCNQAALTILGYTDSRDILGQNLLDLLYPTELESSKKESIAHSLILGKAIYRSNERFVRADKSTFPVEYYMYPLQRGRGRIGGVLQFSDLTEHQKVVEKIEFLAHHDSLTGLPGRLLVADRIEQTIAFAKRTGEKVGILFIDIDNLKLINDSLGHIVGDTLLRSIAQRLRSIVRETDTVGRHGGDEFLVVLTHINRPGAITPILEKIVEVMSQITLIEGHELSSSVSIGVAVYPDDGEDFGTLLTRADMAMYYAKDAGKNTYRFFDNVMNQQSAEALYIRAGLYRALQQGEFILHYQPQIDLSTGKVNAAEALVRWQDSERGLISPAAFIPIAESHGLIVPLGQWVLFEACRQAAFWQKEYGQKLAVAVNISAIQLKRGGLEQTVRDVLEKTGLSPVYLKLELTESILLHDANEVVNTLQCLKALGVKLSIDDFGTGYSCLAYLKQLSVDALKIDQSFIKHMIYDDEDAAIVHAIIKMAHSLNLQVVAEGVEDAQTQAYLRDSLCDEAQGYHIARPLPAQEFFNFVQSVN